MIFVILKYIFVSDSLSFSENKTMLKWWQLEGFLNYLYLECYMLKIREKTILRKHVDRILKKYNSYGVLAIYLYGSLVHGKTVKKSDVDLLIILRKDNVELREVVRKGKEFHHTVISLNVLKQDALHSDKGYLYINKFLGPGIFLYSTENTMSDLIYLFSVFLDNYILKRLKNGKISLNNIVAKTYLTHIKLFPHYVVPLSKWICGPRREELFNIVREKFRKALRFPAKITEKEQDVYILKNSKRDDFLSNLSDEILIVKWWMINQTNHYKNPNFLLDHLNKFYRESKKLRKEIKETLSILERLENE